MPHILAKQDKQMSANQYSNEPQPLIYSELAPWFHLLTAPEDYREEAAFYSDILVQSAVITVIDVLELGCGGGNNASHMKARYNLTLTDLSKDMLAVSRMLNPECEHFQGDMRSLRLNRQFDAVFIHDAVSYMTTREDLSAVMETAFIHCKPGASVLMCPDHISDTFIETTETGGHDDGKRGLRYMDWTWDPENSGQGYVSHFVIIMRDGSHVMYRTDEHHCGMFPLATWLKLLQQAGFSRVKAIDYPKNIMELSITPVFAAVRPL